jgi:hypothetical protein
LRPCSRRRRRTACRSRLRGGGLTTEGESVAYGGVLLDMTGMSRVLKIDAEALTVRTEAGIYWHGLAEELRRDGLDYLSAPLNMTSSVGGTLGVGGIDVNSARLGCSADQAIALQVVTPTGEIVECSDSENRRAVSARDPRLWAVRRDHRGDAEDPALHAAVHALLLLLDACVPRSKTCRCWTATTPATTPASSPSWIAR